MNKVEQQVECSTCQWNKMCVEPPHMTKEELEAKLEESRPNKMTNPDEGEKSIMGSLMSAMFFGGKDTECRGCPVFIEKLRDGPELTQRIKDIMKC